MHVLNYVRYRLESSENHPRLISCKTTGHAINNIVNQEAKLLPIESPNNPDHFKK